MFRALHQVSIHSNFVPFSYTQIFDAVIVTNVMFFFSGSKLQPSPKPVYTISLIGDVQRIIPVSFSHLKFSTAVFDWTFLLGMV